MAGKSIRSVGFLFRINCKYVKFNLPMTRESTYYTNNINKVHYSFLSSFILLKQGHSSVSSKTADISIRQNSSHLENTSRQAVGCPICSQNLTFTYKDVLLLSQFISPEGNILNRRISGVCRKQQRKLEKAIEISRRLGLIPKNPPVLQQKDIDL